MTAPDAGELDARLAHMAPDGYTRHECAPHCPDRGDGKHAHLTSPDGLDFIGFADGTASPFDLTRNSGLVYPVYTPRRATRK